VCVFGLLIRVMMEREPTTKQNEHAEAKGGRSEARCSVCSVVAFEGACLALE